MGLPQENHRIASICKRCRHLNQAMPKKPEQAEPQRLGDQSHAAFQRPTYIFFSHTLFIALKNGFHQPKGFLQKQLPQSGLNHLCPQPHSHWKAHTIL